MSDRMTKVLHAFAALADLGEEIAETSDFEEMVSSALHVVLGALGIRRGAVAEYDARFSVLKFVASRGLGDTHPPDILFSVDEAVAKSGGDATFKSVTAHLEKQVKAALTGLPDESVTPLFVRDELVGVILLGTKASGHPFNDEDRELVRALGRHIGVGLHNHRLLRELEHRAEENRRLYDDLRMIYKDTVRAFAAAIDCKDKYTQGHSERVGKYSEIIARELGWNEEEVEGIAVAGYLHDIGKLVVDRDIINAPYKIDAKQSSELNRHPAAGYEILRPINHPYADIPLMARYHHERIDGRGYPEGLKGDQIPLGAKIVSLADSFDAMTTDRPYKRRRDFNEVVQDFRRNTGKQFAPEVVVAFCRALLKEVNGQVKPRQIVKLLGKDYLEGTSVPAQLEELIAELEAGDTLIASHA
ncbi:MAG: HD domain-containing phosphohydrolase [Pyrinomonadaceae bacterium]